ncbi:iron-containing redox enzyme family protein [Nocardioides sp. KC13]|uniref:Iron-containing redox enzyme family protein n=1 Tax=Nocardioides turkmenicus TaxID=2711220 RepID=A0A6M1RCN4_9ACTN|nr:iron-containing redox enzyme family protein [Nocardioides sp. KC13]NGN95308.1 iron-containing redox enzyme family protein [Nocardioides sp. KC13]
MLPKSRGTLSAAVFTALQSGATADLVPAPESEEDAQVTLWALYELHYRGFDEVDPDLEWDPDLLRLRRGLERSFETELRRRWDASPLREAGELTDLIDGHDGPSLARFVQRKADREQVLEILRHRSLYHLKEADPTSWVVPRLDTRVKAPLMEILFDEYGDGDPNRLHHHLFRRGLEAAGLRTDHACYVDEAPVEVLALNNALSLFGLHRRLRGAALGHFAAFEATSSIPSRQLAQGLRRLEFPDEMAAYYDEHVEADSVHEQVALRDVCGAFLEENPSERDTVHLGAFTCLDLEARYAHAMLTQWGVS